MLRPRAPGQEIAATGSAEALHRLPSPGLLELSEATDDLRHSPALYVPRLLVEGRGVRAPGPQYSTGAGLHLGPGYSDTQAEAVARILPVLRERQAKVIDQVVRAGARGVTLQEATLRLGGESCSWSARFTELRAAGLLVDSGKRRAASDGRIATIVWVLAADPRFDPPEREKRVSRKELERRIDELEHDAEVRMCPRCRQGRLL